ncbi:MAG: protein-disulfide reductase DsbD family protein [Rhodospirillales bacterium]|jgi:suppressor for copper-sensitivity B|nr:protein-disulfide reductase DsbD family protein [Rhodospirillales bacterium]
MRLRHGRPIRGKRALVVALLLSGLGIPAAEAAPPASQWAETEQTAVRLIAATEAAGASEAVPLGIEFRLEKDWKIYWRSPGDAGFPPRPTWSGSENLAEATLSWPIPTRFSVLGLETLGYEDGVVLPVTARLDRPGEPLRLRASIDYLTCKEICIPYTAELALDLPSGDAKPSPFAHLINRFSVRVPGDGAAHGLSIQRVEAVGTEGTALRVVATAAEPFGAPDVFAEGPTELVFDRPEIMLEQAGHVAVATLGVHGLDRLKQPLTAIRLTITVADGPRGAERTVVPIAAGNGDGTASLALIVGLALLGGLILNLMPCVLPVLSIKLLGVISHGGRTRGEVRRSFVATAAGIVFSFLVLAAGLIGVKAAGGVIGWGIQFQQPWFLVAMAVIVTLFAGNLWGFFEFRLPDRLAGLGGPAASSGLGGSFLTGAFATLMATPCSAPFLGTAVAFALARGAGEILAVFAALGLGLALPYLLVAAAPTLATRLPKPGRWMILLRRTLGFALAATAAWLVTVLAGIIGALPAAAIGFVLAAIIGFLAAGHRFGGQFRTAAMVGVAGLATVAFVVPISAGGKAAASGAAALSGVWRPFDQAAIPGHIQNGGVVFVDVTADWCVTCQVNKTFILGREPVITRLNAPSVLAMEADWTRPNTDISRYLASFGRYGIPFNVVYGPEAPQGIVLPELLSESAVLDALDRAAAVTAK